MKIRKALLILVTLAIVTLSGCATVPMASKAQDTEAKQFIVPEGKSSIYVYRNEFLGGAVAMEIDLDGSQVAITRANNYVRLIVEPGKHTITSHAENEHSVDVNAEKGKNHFVWQEAKMGIMMARTKLNLVDEEEGRQGVNECSLVDFVYAEKE